MLFYFSVVKLCELSVRVVRHSNGSAHYRPDVLPSTLQKNSLMPPRKTHIAISYIAFSEGSDNRRSNEAWDCRNSVCNSHQRSYTRVHV